MPMRIANAWECSHEAGRPGIRTATTLRNRASTTPTLTALSTTLPLRRRRRRCSDSYICSPRSEKYRYRIDPSLDTGVKTERSVNDPPKFSGDRKSFDGWLTLLITKMGSTTFTDHQEGLKWMT
jgi:hypothetical protein